jgi:hypothetical protein
MKQAQLTMFIILGLVILSVFGFVFFATTRVQQQQTEQQAQEIAEQILETTALEFYVNLCTERALQEGIDLIAKQGGKIFPHQNGSILRQPEKAYLYRDIANNKVYSVGYGIVYDKTPTPQYPCKPGYENFNKAPAFCYYRSNNPAFNNLDFGINNLPKLCKDRFGGCTLREGWDTRFSVQAELEAYVSTTVKTCVDFDSIVGLNQTYLVKEGNVTTNITFSDTSINAIVYFPLVISPIGTQPVIQLLAFQSSLSTRFKQLYGFARDAVVSDVVGSSAPSFNFLTGFKDVVKRRFGDKQSGYIIERRANASLYDSFIRLVDTTAEPDKELIIQFLIENRPPVLEYLNPLGPAGKDPPAGCGIFDLVQLEGQLLKIEPKFFDTEENPLNVTYDGWLYSYNETVKGQVVNANGCIVSSIRTKTPYVTVGQRRLQKASDYAQTGARFVQLTDADIGPHNITISVCDAQYCDSHIFRVLIDDLLKVKVNKSNPYDTKPPIFSIEDPYFFTAVVEDIYNPGNYKFEWSIHNDALGKPATASLYSNPEGDTTINLPLQPYDIQTIVTAHTTLSNGQPFLILGNKYWAVAKATQEQKYQAENRTSFVAEACIPYKKANNLNKPFPYNTSDPFFADHMCCNDDRTFKGVTATCFASDSYGSYNSFNPDKYQKKYDLQATKIAPSVKLPSTFVNFATDLGSDPLAKIKQDIQNNQNNPSYTIHSNANDIIKRSFERKCSGTRGNVCVGDTVDTFTAISCTNKLSAEQGTCSGPPLGLLNLNSEIISSATVACMQYDRNTFENITGIKDSIICNGQPKCVSSDNTATGFISINPATAHFVCNATCSGSSGCARTLPYLCTNCYAKQTCGDTEATPDPKIEGTITYRQFNSCAGASPVCNLLPEVQQDDVCSTDGFTLTEYSCKTTASIATSNQPYLASPVNCKFANEEAALDQDNANNLYFAGVCEYSYGLGSCATGSCVKNTAIQQEGNIELTNGDFKLREYLAADTNGNAVKESCVVFDNNYDALTDGTLCSDAQFKDGNGNPKNGVWDASKTGEARCCGDDVVERGTCP